MSNTDADLYLETAYAQAELLTKAYSTSFSRAIQTLDAKYRRHIYAIYAVVRLGDEIVDAGFDIDMQRELARFESQVYEALEKKYSSNPILHAFQATFHQYSLDKKLVASFFKSMEMDIAKKSYTAESFSQYVYGSAEVVGLLCLPVFCDGDAALAKKLEQGARDLGASFQKVNFLRDLHSDGLDRGRVYFPNMSLEHFTDADKRELERDIEMQYDSAALAIAQLPRSPRIAVATALEYYRALLHEIKKVSAQELVTRRVRVPDSKKLLLAVKVRLNQH